MEDSPSPSKNDRRSRSTTKSPSNCSSKSSAVSRSATSRSSGHKSSQEMSMSRTAKDSLKIVEVANLAAQATRGQLQALFGYVGKIEDIRLYPTVDIGLQLKSKICFVKFYSSKSVATAQHLTNTVFMDQALIVIPYADGDIPDETTALELLTSGSLLPGIADPKLPQHVTSQLEGIPPVQVVVTNDPKLAEKNLPEYPPLPPTADWRKIEEIRRTVNVCNIDDGLTAQDVMDFFSKAGEIKYLRFCTRDNDPLTYAMIEFLEQPSVLQALGLNGQYLGSKMIWVYHATQAITKPQAKTNEAAQKEIEEAMTRHAENLLAEGLDTIVYPSPKEKRSGRSKRKSRSRRSRSPIFRVLRQPRSGSRKRSNSRSRKRSSSKSRKRSSSRSRGTSSRHRSNSKAKRSARSRSRGRRSSRTRKRPRSTKPSRSRKSRSRSHSRRSRSRSRISRKHEDKKKSKKDKDRNKDTDKPSNKNKDHGKLAADEVDVQTKESKSRSKPDRQGRSPRSESKKGRRSSPRSGSHSRKVSSSSHEKKRSKSNKKNKDSSDREFSMDSVGHSSQEKQ